MPQLHRVTTQYDVIEDRFRLTAELTEGGTVLLWLNQRLLLRLLPHFFTWLEKQQVQQSSIDLQSAFAQEAAANALAPEEEVQETPDLTEYLITSIDVTPTLKGIHLRFKSKDTNTSEISFTEQQLRQWLTILFSQWSIAEWPAAVWPEWFAAAKTDENSSVEPRNFH